jgi:phosphoadenosine phosphosulfate reductase
VYWCDDCQVPIIREVVEKDKNRCTLCGKKTKRIASDIRPVFPEERLLVELVWGIINKDYSQSSNWVSNRKYFFGDRTVSLSNEELYSCNISKIREALSNNCYEEEYFNFNNHINKFIEANVERLHKLKTESYEFINNVSLEKGYSLDQILVSFSGGKDSTVVSDLVTKALSTSEIKHIFGDTTLELPQTYTYKQRFQKNNPFTVVSTAKNREQNFYDMCDIIGPPSRVMRWCCHMFKTGPISRKIDHIFKDSNILTFYGIRSSESVSRSKYERVFESPKIIRQRVASPIFGWKDVDIWLYMLGENVDFNDAYRMGFDRVGCWCCPNNNERSIFLSKVYYPELSKKWNTQLVNFAKKIGKPDPENYISEGGWKARQGGYGVDVAKDVNVNFEACTTAIDAQIYSLNKEIQEYFYELFIPLGVVSKELGRKILKEHIVLDVNTNEPLLSIQPFTEEVDNYSVKIQILKKNLSKKDKETLFRKVEYQVRKYNACRGCLGCESVCRFRAITIRAGVYNIDKDKCTRCGKCIDPKYITRGCLMAKYLFSSEKGSTKKDEI